MTLSLRKPLVAVFAVVMLVAMIGIAEPAQAACAQDNTKTTSSSKSSTYGLNAYWTTTDTYTGGSPCNDINVINQNRSENVTGSYQSGGSWHPGTAGWLFGPQYELIPVITSISGTGIPFRTASKSVGSTIQRQLS
jgi:hypothetical protein